MLPPQRKLSERNTNTRIPKLLYTQKPLIKLTARFGANCKHLSDVKIKLVCVIKKKNFF